MWYNKSWVYQPDSLWVHSAPMLRPLSCVSSLTSPPEAWARFSKPARHFHGLTNFPKVLPISESKVQHKSISQHWRWQTRSKVERSSHTWSLLYLFSNESLQYLPSSVHSSQPLSKVCLVTALSFHILTADLQHRLIYKVNSQLLTGQIYIKTLRDEEESSITCDKRNFPVTVQG